MQIDRVSPSRGGILGSCSSPVPASQGMPTQLTEWIDSGETPMSSFLGIRVGPLTSDKSRELHLVDLVVKKHQEGIWIGIFAS